MRGLWQLANFVLGCRIEDRPDVLLVQEVAFKPEQLLGIEKFWDQMGYKTFEGTHSGYISRGLEKGVISFVRSCFRSSSLVSAGQSRGALLGIEVEEVLVLNSYAYPDWTHQQDQATLIEEVLISLDWRHHMVLAGDFNEEWSNSWVSITAALHGLHVVPMDSVSTRWGGSKVLDYFLVDEGIKAEARTLAVKIADHKIIALDLDLHWVGETGQRFRGYKNFHKPGWLSVEGWRHCMDKAVQLGIQSGWLEVCYDINHSAKWVHSDFCVEPGPGGGTCPRDRCYLKPGCWGHIEDSGSMKSQGMEQDMVDYGWDLFSRKVVWSLRQACYIALLRIPEGYHDFEDIRRIEALFNGSHVRGNNHFVERSFPRTGAPCHIRVRKLRKRLGRVLELQTRLNLGRLDEETVCLCCKLFGEMQTIGQVNEEVKKLQSLIYEMESAQRHRNLTSWRKRIQGSLQAKGEWIQSKKGRKNLSLKLDGKVTQTKREVTSGLYQVWMKRLEEVRWDPDERPSVTLDMKHFFRDRLGSYEGRIQRPDAQAFAAVLRHVSGCPGLDGWSTFEATSVADNRYLSSASWEEMHLWEECGCAPSSLLDILLLFVPKVGRNFDQGFGEPSDFRPLSIFSIFWRAWSSTWVTADCFHQFIQAKLPLGLTASHRGGTGAEALAAVCAHQLDKLGYGCTLDFSACFDTVDLRSITDSLGPCLPEGLRLWFQLLMHHWMAVSKWIGSNGYIYEKPVCEPTGIPQGDGASPIILAFVLWQGFSLVEEKMSSIGGSFFQGIYMDDRTLIAERPDMIEEAISCWRCFADRRRLVENEKKAQKVSLFGDVEGYGEQMEVLGVQIGMGSWLGVEADSKQVKRIQKSLLLIRRIGILPEAKWKRMQDIFTFVHGIYSYGWVNSGPTSSQCKEIRSAILSSVGRFAFGVPLIKRILLLVHLDLQERVLVRQMRLLARRDFALSRFGVEKVACHLDHMVYRGLIGFGWQEANGSWSLNGFQFSLEDCLNDYMWKKVSHEVRESVRRWHFGELMQLSRHEFVGQVIPPYDSWRVDVVRKWIRKNSLAMMIATGSLGSGATRKKSQPSMDFPCPKCGELNVFWEHYWTCWAGCPPPEDLLLRRFLWPRSREDFPLMDCFLKHAGQLIASHQHASWGSQVQREESQ